MQLHRSRDSIWYRLALCMALVAMHLVLAGPLISQYQAGGQQHAHHHATYDAKHHASHRAAGDHLPEAAPIAHHGGTTQTVEPVFSWFHACGYCSIWQQFPSAHALVPAIARQAFVHHAYLIQTPLAGFAPIRQTRHAPPRAPPG